LKIRRKRKRKKGVRECVGEPFLRHEKKKEKECFALLYDRRRA
jgi:hypothetical protein